MLSSDKLKELAVKGQTTELNVKREYLQNIFLSYLYQKPLSREIFFKGGTALKIIHNSPRFSEDLDFSSSLTTKKLIENVVKETLKDIIKANIDANLVESKQTSGGYFAIVEFKLLLKKIDVQLEVSFRDKSVSGEIMTIINDFIPTYTLVSLKQEDLISQKIQALISRRKPRDFYDLYFILRANLLEPQERKVLPTILSILEKSKISFNKELQQFLPRSHWMIIKDFKTTLKREMERYGL